MNTELHAIDWSLCLERGNHQAELAHELLSMLVAELPTYSKQIENAYAQQDMSLLSLHLDKLHGACCYSGVPRLQQLVKSAYDHIEENKQPPTAGNISQILNHIQMAIDDAAKLEAEVI